MDDESGWHEVLVDGWGPLVREAVCDRVEETFASSRGVLAVAVSSPDDAPVHATERVHLAVLAAIARETGADLDALGSQSAWATYDDVWAELGRRAPDLERFEPLAPAAVAQVEALLASLPPTLTEHAGATVDDDGDLLLVEVDGAVLLDVEGVHRWLALDEHADASTRDRARELVRLARSHPAT